MLPIFTEGSGAIVFLKWFQEAAEHPVWRFCAKGISPEHADPLLLRQQNERCGAFVVTKNEYGFDGGRAVRIFATDGKHVGVLAEWFLLDDSRSVYTSFHCPITSDINCNVVGKNRLVFRSADEGAKLFRLVAMVDGADAMEGSGLLLPDGFFDSNTMRFTPYSGLYGFGREHLSIFAMTQERRDKVKGWHMENGDGIEISAPDKSCRVRIYAERDKLMLVDPVTGEHLTFMY